jgi:hypothetical protein
MFNSGNESSNAFDNVAGTIHESLSGGEGGAAEATGGMERPQRPGAGRASHSTPVHLNSSCCVRGITHHLVPDVIPLQHCYLSQQGDIVKLTCFVCIARSPSNTMLERNHIEQTFKGISSEASMTNDEIRLVLDPARRGACWTSPRWRLSRISGITRRWGAGGESSASYLSFKRLVDGTHHVERAWNEALETKI